MDRAVNLFNQVLKVQTLQINKVSGNLILPTGLHEDWFQKNTPGLSSLLTPSDVALPSHNPEPIAKETGAPDFVMPHDRSILEKESIQREQLLTKIRPMPIPEHPLKDYIKKSYDDVYLIDTKARKADTNTANSDNRNPEDTDNGKGRLLG